MQGPGMWSLLRVAGQTGVPSRQRVLWQLDVVLAPRAEVSSYTGLNSTDITAACSSVCLHACVHARQREPRGRPLSWRLIMPLLAYGRVLSELSFALSNI